MKPVLIALTMVCAAMPAFANLTSNGFYRVQNAMSQRWANLIDNKASVDIGSSTADLHALELTKDYDEIISDPGSIVFVTKISGNQYDISAQGITLADLMDNPVNIGPNGTGENGQEMYQIYGTYKGVTKYIGDANYQSNSVTGTASINVSLKDFTKWYFEPVSSNSDNFFGPVPSVSANDGLYTTLFSSFAYQPVSQDVKAYYISRVGYGMAEMVEIAGAVPPGSPVVIKCAGQNAADNKMDLLQSQDALPSNSLTGVYFDYQSRSQSNITPYDPQTMRVLGTCSDGSLGFVTADIDYIPGNTAYLKVPAGSSPEFKCVSSETYEQNLPTAPEDFYFTESFVLLPQGDDIYSGSGYIPAPENGTDVKIRFYIPSSRADETYVGPYSSSNSDVVINGNASLPFEYSSPYYWVLPNWEGGDVSVTLNLKYQYITFNTANAGVETIISDANALFYAGGEIYCQTPSNIVVYNMAGQVVTKGYGNSLDVSNLPKGIYVASANGATIKFAR